MAVVLCWSNKNKDTRTMSLQDQCSSNIEEVERRRSKKNKAVETTVVGMGTQNRQEAMILLSH
jgi:hypothetical protein